MSLKRQASYRQGNPAAPLNKKEKTILRHTMFQLENFRYTFKEVYHPQKGLQNALKLIFLAKLYLSASESIKKKVDLNIFFYFKNICERVVQNSNEQREQDASMNMLRQH